MEKHTAGKWYVEGSNPPRIYANNGMDIIAQCDSMKEMPRTEERANAQRIVACVNACAGYDTDDLREGRDLRAESQADTSTIDALRSENENFRRRLSDVLEGLEGITLPGAMPVRVAKARAALNGGGK